MKRRGSGWTIDWAGDGEPEVGHVVRHITAGGKPSYARILTVREVRTRKPMKEPYVARYRATIERLRERPQEPVAWTLWAHPRIRKDRWSPLLDADPA